MQGEVAQLAQPAFSSDLRECLSATTRRGARCLVVGNLRSYGDEVLNRDGHYVQTTLCDRILHLDLEGDTVTCECGITIDTLQRRLAPLGYMLPVTPGTAFLTVGGAIANDVHGKNHHVAGTFGCFVERFELVRSTGEAWMCSPTKNSDWFAATIGGMGLTGAITWATLKLRRITSPLLHTTSRRFADLAEFFAMDEQQTSVHEYSVAWIDCLAGGDSLGRGIFSVADHDSNPARVTVREYPKSEQRFSVPFALPISPVNGLSLRLFNELYSRIHRSGQRQIHFKDWLYPLDSIASWNRLYGKRGFFQFQCVVPPLHAREAIADMLKIISEIGQGSFLAVLKNFADKPSPGLMSFPMPGTTLALDFPNLGARTRELLLGALCCHCKRRRATVPGQGCVFARA